MSLQQELGFRNPLDHQGHEALLNIVLTGSLLNKEGMRLFRPFGITEAQFNVLMLLKFQSEGGRINQTSLGNMMLVNRSNITGLVDRMEKASLVRRTADSEDRRVNLVEMTAEGESVLEQAGQAYFKRIDEIMAGMTKAEYRLLAELLERIRQLMNGWGK
ncbi:MAG: MarR family transcriptional regulator [Candidatus Glassbacteria bacterium]